MIASLFRMPFLQVFEDHSSHDATVGRIALAARAGERPYRDGNGSPACPCKIIGRSATVCRAASDEQVASF
jgi:hypothetical protein